MRSPSDKETRVNDDGNAHILQGTLDAFGRGGPEGGIPGDTGPSSVPEGGAAPPHFGTTHQESIDSFGDEVGTSQGNDDGSRGSRAMQGLAQEMEMERIALTEAASGIARDELILTVARLAQVPLERLDMVDAYITDLELEGRLWRVGDTVVLARPEDEDLLAQDLSEEEFLERFRQRHPTTGRGSER